MAACIVAMFCIGLLSPALGLDNGLGRVPAMGYNTWNAFHDQSKRYHIPGSFMLSSTWQYLHASASTYRDGKVVLLWPLYGCTVDSYYSTTIGVSMLSAHTLNEELLIKQAQRLIDLGLRDVGYTYFNVDDAWASPYRTADQRIVADDRRFPSGMKALGDILHEIGLRFGIYSDAGARTCLGVMGSRHHEKEDAQSFAAWGVDYLKYDNCYIDPRDDVIPRYEAMRDALNASGRPILLSMCEWGVASPWLWAAKVILGDDGEVCQQVGNSWRTTADVGNSWEDILRGLDDSVGLAQFAGPGGFNDPDMLQVGNNGLKLCEERAHFALWAALKSPLLIGADLRTIHPASLSVLLNKEIIAVNQDPLAVPADLIWKQGAQEVYAGPLQGPCRVAVLFNRLNTDSQYPTTNITLLWAQVGIRAEASCTVRELYRGQELGSITNGLRVPVALRDVVVLKITCTQEAVEADWRPWHASTTQHMYRRTDGEEVAFVPLEPLSRTHDHWLKQQPRQPGSALTAAMLAAAGDEGTLSVDDSYDEAAADAAEQARQGGVHNSVTAMES